MKKSKDGNEDEDKAEWTTANVRPDTKRTIKNGAKKLGITQNEYLSRAVSLTEQTIALAQAIEDLIKSYDNR